MQIKRKSASSQAVWRLCTHVCLEYDLVEECAYHCLIEIVSCFCQGTVISYAWQQLRAWPAQGLSSCPDLTMIGKVNEDEGLVPQLCYFILHPRDA